MVFVRIMVMMGKSDSDTFSVFHIIMIITGLVVIIGGMMQARVVLVPLIMAIFIAIVCRGPISWFQGKGVPEWLALFMVLALLCCAGLFAVVVVGSSVKDFLHNIPEYESKLRQQMEQLYTFLGSKGVHLEEKGLRETLKPEVAIKYAGQLFSELSSLFANGFIVLLMVIFISLEAGGLPAKLKAVYGTDDKQISWFQKYNASVKHYMSIKTIVSFVTGSLVSISL